jgi:hypothetical protein
MTGVGSPDHSPAPMGMPGAARGLLAGRVAAAIFLAADGAPRAVHDQAVSASVARLWIEAALLSIAIAALGAATAHAITRSRR